MALLTVTEVRDHVEADINDTALGRLVDNADQEIIDRLGALATQTWVDQGGRLILHLPRKATSITSAVERLLETDYTLAASDYELLGDGYQVQRKQGSGYPYQNWRGRVTIVFVPSDETVARKKLLVDLVKLDVQYDALRGSSLGDVSRTNLDHAAERNALFQQLMTRNRRMRIE